MLMSSTPYSEQRMQLIHQHVKPSGVTDERVLKALMIVPRHEFISKSYQSHAYEDHPLPIGKEQTISQPSLVGLMTQLLELTGTEKVLEIGTGSGYQTALLSLLAKKVISIERIKSLADNAAKLLQQLGYVNVTVIFDDGTKGYRKEAPFDAIMVTAAAPKIPRKLVQQLKEGGRIILPVVEDGKQLLKKGIKKNGRTKFTSIARVSFVPMISNGTG